MTIGLWYSIGPLQQFSARPLGDSGARLLLLSSVLRVLRNSPIVQGRPNLSAVTHVGSRRQSRSCVSLWLPTDCWPLARLMKSITRRFATIPSHEGARTGDRQALRRQRGGGADLLDAGGESLCRHLVGVPCRSGRAFAPCAQPGQLLGADPWLPQQRREQPTVGKHHQGRQRHGPVA